MSAPLLFDLVKKRLAIINDEAEAKQFFNIKRKPGKDWLATLQPGLDAGQRVLNAHVAEQSGQPDTQTGKTDDFDKIEVLVNDLFFGVETLEKLKAAIAAMPAGEQATLTFSKEDSGEVKLNITAGKPEKEPFVPFPDTEPHEAALVGELDELLNQLAPKVRLTEGDSARHILDAVVKGHWSRKVVMLYPAYSDVNPHAMYSVMAHIRKQPWLGFEYETDTIIQRTRNLLVQKFLRSEAEWAWFVDSDTIAPFGDPGFFYDPKRLGADERFIRKEFVDVMAVNRMMKAGKTIIGAVYQQRRTGGRLVIQPHIQPKGGQDEETVQTLLTRGPQDKVIPVDWVGTGCVMIHRSVFNDIIARNPEKQPRNAAEPFDFFGHDVSREGEDMAFCRLAAEAGHQSFLDLGLWCAHLGKFAFFPQKQN